MAVDMNKLMAFVGKAVVDIGGTMHAALVMVGEKRGIYKALAKGACSSEELAKRTSSNERYVRECSARRPRAATLNTIQKRNSTA